ncbi:HNH endonuclease signature motif containing protein [Blastococcus sp. SYSU DS0533]
MTDHGDGDDSGRWAAAHGSLQAAADALLGLDRAIGHARRMVTAAERADREDEDAWLRSAEGRITRAPSDLDACAEAGEHRRAALAALLDASGGGTLVDRPRIAGVDELTGALLALTDSCELRRLARCDDGACHRAAAPCTHDLTGRPGLDPPGPTDGYRPGASPDRYLPARDRRCRFPGCRRRVPLGGELDHDRPWPEGPTSADDLTGFCTGHHRDKHQAPGWRYELAPDGRLTVTTPTGLIATTTPPPF